MEDTDGGLPKIILDRKNKILVELGRALLKSQKTEGGERTPSKGRS